MVKLWHISDTHSYHSLLTIPKDVDIVIFSGDESNYFDVFKNEQECRNFITWYSGLNIKNKIFVAGNHSSAIAKGHITKENFNSAGIIYLENDSISIEGLNIWGSPITPTFGNWHFMKSRDKLHDLWQTIPEDADIIISHGPPKGSLDLSYSRENVLEFCGCTSLAKRCAVIQPKLMLFGHIHNCQEIINAGVLYKDNTYYSNGSVMTDGKFGKLSSNGNLFEIDDNKNVRIL